MARTKTDLRTRFENKFDKTEGCWEWKGSTFERYGRIRVDGRKSKLERTHRVAYELYVGPIPSGMCVCHKCDNTKCVNPDHLFLGTHSENMKDMWNKNRHNKPKTNGENNPSSKLTNEQVTNIKLDCRKQKDISKEYGVSEATISLIKNNKRWKV